MVYKRIGEKDMEKFKIGEKVISIICGEVVKIITIKDRPNDWWKRNMCSNSCVLLLKREYEGKHFTRPLYGAINSQVGIAKKT